MIYYNEFNPESAAMIKQFMLDGLIPLGNVDTRPIQEIDPDELKRYTQCHFFAGIAGWTFALQLANWPTDRPVWTGSCPCQPFSSAGRQKGKTDERHLWPVWFGLIKECKPATIYGEQVSSAVAHGWLDDVYEGLESEGYAVGSVVLPASSVGAPHKRDRLWFVAHCTEQGLEGAAGESLQRGGLRSSERSTMGDTQLHGHAAPEELRSNEATGNKRREERKDFSREPSGASSARNVPSVQGRVSGEREGPGDVADTKCKRPSGQGELRQPLYPTENRKGEASRIDNASAGDWENGVWIDCPDGKQRLIESSIPLLADGFPYRKPILHALGNAIVPQVAAEVIKVSM